MSSAWDGLAFKFLNFLREMVLNCKTELLFWSSGESQTYLCDKLCSGNPAVSFSVVLQAKTAFAKGKFKTFFNLSAYKDGPYKVKMQVGPVCRINYKITFGDAVLFKERFMLHLPIAEED